MELLNELFLYAFTAVLVSFLVSKLISWAVNSGDVNGEKEPCGGGGVGEGSLEKKLEVKGLKSLKKRRKKIAAETVLVSEFKGETEPAIGDEYLVGLVKADDDRKEVAFSDDRLLSAGEVGGVESSVFPTVIPAETEGLVSSSEINLNEVGCPAEGSQQEINSGDDLERLTVNDQKDYKEDDVVEEEIGRFDFSPKEEAGSVGQGDRELGNVVLPSERRELSEGPKFDDVNDMGLLSGGNAIDDQHEHHRILESLEFEPKFCTQDECADELDDRIEELSSSASKEDVVVNRDQETERSELKNVDSIHVGLLGGDELNDVVKNEEGRIGNGGIEEMEISDEEEWEGIERNELERDFAKAMNFVECGSKDGQLSTLGSDVIMQFYGLQKVSMEGTCHESPPMPLKLSARAKWNAWQKLGSMIPEEAMEKYINLLSEKVPGWMGDHPFVEEGKPISEEDGACSSSDANISKTLTVPPLTCIDESKNEADPAMADGDITGNSTR